MGPGTGMNYVYQEFLKRDGIHVPKLDGIEKGIQMGDSVAPIDFAAKMCMQGTAKGVHYADDWVSHGENTLRMMVMYGISALQSVSICN